MVRFAETGMSGDTLQAWYNKFSGTDTSQTCKRKEEFKVTTAAAGEALTWEVLKTTLCTIKCLKVEFLYWYVDVVVTFTTLKGGTETALTERRDKSTLNTLQQTLTAHSLTWVTEALKIGRLQKHGHIHYSHQEKSYERNIYKAVMVCGAW